MVVELAAAGVLLWALAQKKKDGKTPSPSDLDKPEPEGLGPPRQRSGPGALGIAKSAAGIVAAIAGGATATALAAIAAGIYGGWEAGKALDRWLGGDGRGTGATILSMGLATLGGLTAAALAAKVGVSAFAFMASAYPIAALVAVVVMAVAYILHRVSDEVDRLNGGQRRAHYEFEQSWQQVCGDAMAKLEAKEPHSTFAERLRIAVPFTDGWMELTNELAFQKWMRRRGGASQVEHAVYGRERAWFLGELYAEGDNPQTNVPRMYLAPYLRAIGTTSNLASDTVGESRQHADPSKPQNSPQPWEPQQFSLLHLPHYVPARELAPYRYAPGGLEVYAVERVRDRWAGAFHAAGRELANVGAYVAAMQETWGGFQSERSHARYMEKEGWFFGTIVDGANGTAVLEWNGRYYYWKETSGAFGPREIAGPYDWDSPPAPRAPYEPPPLAPALTMKADLGAELVDPVNRTAGRYSSQKFGAFLGQAPSSGEIS